ncbi:hypothetical protein [Treponema primitia]|uniref:hypothetical protein n=1 Tax=Treponema primitia TaxID=88058 RepID=UPI0012FD036B|nr:hypothetical protein [Treponema primitia]
MNELEKKTGMSEAEADYWGKNSCQNFGLIGKPLSAPIQNRSVYHRHHPMNRVMQRCSLEQHQKPPQLLPFHRDKFRYFIAGVETPHVCEENILGGIRLSVGSETPPQRWGK